MKCNLNYIYTKTSEEWKALYIDVLNQIENLTSGDNLGVKTIKNDTDEITVEDTSKILQVLLKKKEMYKNEYFNALNYENKKCSNDDGITNFNREYGL